MEEASDGLSAAKQRVRHEVAGLVPPNTVEASAMLLARLEAVVGRTDRVLTFSPLPDEPDLTPFARPRMLLSRTPDQGWLTIHPADGPLERHRWGFLQPTAEADEVDPDEVHVVLVPGVAFGEDGSRLGHGKGYYDELLARMPFAVRIGIGWECRMRPSVPTGELDLPMHAIVTEERIRRLAA